MDRKLNLKDKVQEINQRFALKSKKSLNTDSLENKVTQMKKKLTSLALKNNQEMQTIKEQAAVLLQKSEESNILYQNQANSQLKQLEQLTQELSLQIENEIYQRKESQNQIIDLIQKKSKFLRTQIQKQKKVRQDILSQISNTLQKDVPTLMKLILDNAVERQQSEEKLNDLLNCQLQGLKHQNQQFKERQETNQKKIYDLIRELTLKAKKQIEDQRKVREDTHDEILSYVEDTCNKLEQGTQSKA